VASVYSGPSRKGGTDTDPTRKTNAAQEKIWRGCDDTAQLTVGEVIAFKPGVQHCYCRITGNTEVTEPVPRNFRIADNTSASLSMGALVCSRQLTVAFELSTPSRG
jgi:hypothetical protein